MTIPIQLKKILRGLPPCQKKQILVWFVNPGESPPFMFCRRSSCKVCRLYKSTMLTVCPYCDTSVATTVIVPQNGLALCRKVPCVCGQNFRIVFSDRFCEVCALKASCLSIPSITPKLCLHEKIK